VSPSTNHSSSQETRLNDLGIKIWTDLSSVLSLAFDGRTEFSSLDRICIPSSAVKNEEKFLSKLYAYSESRGYGAIIITDIIITISIDDVV